MGSRNREPTSAWPLGQDPTTTGAWQRLAHRADEIGRTTIRDLQDADPDRPRTFTWSCGPLTLDASRQRIDAATVEALLALADECGVLALRDAMFRGDRINTTEQRSVLHTALRRPRGDSLTVEGEDVVGAVHEVLDRMAGFAEQVRSGVWVGATGEPFRTVVNIGIGGSDLGPVMACRALEPSSGGVIAAHFVSNVDPGDLDRVLRQCDPARTLFIVASKTFTTIETMTNAQSARRWLVQALGERAVSRHFVAVSTNLAEVESFGIDPQNVFAFWDWVGGRYSLGSAIGLSTMIAIGPPAFEAMLEGFADMDAHFMTADPAVNLPVLLGLIAVWNRDFLRIPTAAVLPYSDALGRLPAYLQQLVMESNGKSVRVDGTEVTYPTSPIIWGEPGTNGQHSFYQLLHQGTEMVACDVIVVARPAVGSDPSLDTSRVAIAQDLLVANALAQASVLARGRTRTEVAADGTPPALVAHKVMPGNRPVALITLDHLDPHTLGMLVALYEHSVLVQAAVWGLNAFDQWGVEYGKHVAIQVEQAMVNPMASAGLDASTVASLAWYRRARSD